MNKKKLLSMFSMSALISLPLLCTMPTTLSEATAAITTPKKSVKKVKKSKSETKEINNEQLMCSMYMSISGFGIPQHEENIITECGGAPTYGEILYESLKVLIDDLPASVKKNGVFYDLGSGVGKVAIQTYLDYPEFKKVVGIELSKKRFDGSMDAVDILKQLGRIDQKRVLQFLNHDFTKVDISDATAIYMCSTCYSQELMAQLAEKFSKLKKGLHVITLKSIPDYEQYGLELTKEYKLPMTWSKDSGGSPVYVYKLVGKKKAASASSAKNKSEKKKDKKKQSK